MGTSAFSFVRYYSMAPVILNFAVFLAAQVCLLNLIAANVTGSSGRRLAGPGLGYGLLWFICFGVALLMHNQEGLFILLMAMGTLAWMIYQRWVTSQELSARRQLLFVVPALILTGILVLVAMKTVFGEIPRTVSDLGRVVADPGCDDAVITGEHEDRRVGDARLRVCAPTRDVDRDVVEPLEGTAGPQHAFGPGTYLVRSPLVERRQVDQQCAQGGRHGSDRPSSVSDSARPATTRWASSLAATHR